MAEVITLTPAERERFADWLEQEATTIARMVELLSQTPCEAAVGKRMKTEATACAIVALKLRSIEDMTVG